MNSAFSKKLPIIGAFLVGLLILYFKTDSNTLYEFVAFSLLILLVAYIFFDKFLLARKIQIFSSLFLFFLTIFIQTLILSSGAIISPFLLLLYLYAIGLSFIISIQESIIFLICSFILLTAYTVINEELKRIVLNYPITILLFLSSFFTIVPLSIIISRYYHIKDTILDSFKKKINLTTIQQESILSAVNELIFITNKDSTILSANKAAKKTLSMGNSEIIGKPFFNSILIKNQQNIFLDKYILEPIVQQKKPQLFEDLLLFNKQAGNSFQKASLQIRPLDNVRGDIDQLLFIINTVTQQENNEKKPSNVERAFTIHRALMERLKESIPTKDLNELKFLVARINNLEEDLFYTLELENNPRLEEATHVNIAELCRKTTLQEKEFAEAFHVNLNFELLNFGLKDIQTLLPQGMTIPLEQATPPFFTVLIPLNKFEFLVKKLLELAVLLSSGGQKRIVEITILRKESVYVLIIKASDIYIQKDEEPMIFTEYYDSLNLSTNLNLGSGLEGYIGKKLAKLLNIPLVIESNPTAREVTFQLTINKNRSNSVKG